MPKSREAVRKFVTGDERRIAVNTATRQKPCDVCGKPVTVTVSFVGYVLCPSCIKNSDEVLRSALK